MLWLAACREVKLVILTMNMLQIDSRCFTAAAAAAIVVVVEDAAEEATAIAIVDGRRGTLRNPRCLKQTLALRLMRKRRPPPNDATIGV